MRHRMGKRPQPQPPLERKDAVEVALETRFSWVDISEAQREANRAERGAAFRDAERISTVEIDQD